MKLQNFWKIKLRYDIREKIKNKDFSLVLEKSKNISNKIINLDEVKNAKTIFIYVSFFKDEVQTFDLINYFISIWKEVIVTKIVKNEAFLIKLIKEAKLMRWKYDFLWSQYNWKIDIAITPWLWFSTDWKRIWRWWWYYDRFFEKNPWVYKIWICKDFFN